MANKRVDGHFLTASLVTEHTVASSVTATLVEVWLTNTDTVNRQVTLHMVELGGTAGPENAPINHGATNALRPNESRKYSFIPHLKTGDFIEAKADVTLKVAMMMSVTEEGV